MPVENIQIHRRYLSIQAGRMKERIGESISDYSHLSGVHLVDITFRDVEKEVNGIKKSVGNVLQLHLLDATDYFIVETWSNSAYARCFYQVMQNLDVNKEFTLITSEKVAGTQKKGAIFFKQDGCMLKWCYTKDNMQDCPQLNVATGPNGESVYDDTMQTIQTSAFPDERPDQIVKCNLKKARTGEKRLKQFLDKEGPYSFCKMAEEIRRKSEAYCNEQYGATPEEVFRLCERIFGEYVLWRESIETFLKKVRTIPNYNINSLIAKKIPKPKGGGGIKRKAKSTVEVIQNDKERKGVF